MNENVPSPAPSAPAPKRSRFSPTQVVGAILLLAAVALYASNCRRETAQDASVALIRGFAAGAVQPVGLALPPAGTNAPVFRAATPEISAAVVKALAGAAPLPKRADLDAAVRTLDLQLVVTNAGKPQLATLRVDRIPGAEHVVVRPVGEGAERFVPVAVQGLGGVADSATPEKFESLLAPPQPAAVVEIRIGFPGEEGTPASELDPDDAPGALRTLFEGDESLFWISKATEGTNGADRVFMPVPSERADRFREALRAAERADFPTNAPDEMVKGDLYALHVFFGKNPLESVQLQAAVLEDRPADVFVRFVREAPEGGLVRASATALAAGFAETLEETWKAVAPKR